MRLSFVFALPAVAILCAALASLAAVEQIGAISTVFCFVGRNDRIVVEADDDPKVTGVTCYVTRAHTGGISGTVGLAEDRAEASIGCRQVVDTLRFNDRLPLQKDVFSECQSILFKRLHIVRIVDSARDTLVYLTCSDKLIEGSPQNSIATVPVPDGMSISLRK